MFGELLENAVFTLNLVFVYVGNKEAAEYMYPNLFSSIYGAARGGRLQHGELRKWNAAANGPIYQADLVADSRQH